MDVYNYNSVRNVATPDFAIVSNVPNTSSFSTRFARRSLLRSPPWLAAASALGAAGSLASFTSLAAVDPYLGVALGGFAFVTGAVASVRSVTLIRSSFLTTYARFSSRLQKEILANFDSEVETLKTNLDSQCTPFAKYVEAEMATCRSRKKESEEVRERTTLYARSSPVLKLTPVAAQAAVSGAAIRGRGQQLDIHRRIQVRRKVTQN